MDSQYLDLLERTVMVGRARWVADFTESFRDIPLAGHRFALFLRGRTRPAGLLLSRLFAYFSLPDYRPACFVHSAMVRGKGLEALIRDVGRFLEEHSHEWGWLVLVADGDVEPGLAEAVAARDDKRIGVGLVDPASRTIVTSRSHVGQRLRDILRCWA